MASSWDGIVVSRNQGIAEVELASMEERIGLRLPEDYRRFMLASNGGKISFKHQIVVPGFPYSLELVYLDPMTEASPGVGVMECRELQIAWRICGKNFLQIGTDPGAGYWYIDVGNRNRGWIYYIFKDDVPYLSESEWQQEDGNLPDGMVEVASGFSELGELVLKGRISET